jgi:acyl-CoA thioesterase
MQLSSIMDGLQAQAEGCSVDVPDTWTQGRTVFGGLQAALLVRAMRMRLPALPPLRSLQVAFVGPVLPGRLHLHVQCLRQGKSVTQVEARIVGTDGAIACLAIAVFGQARESALRWGPTRPPVLLTPEASAQIPRVPGLSPAFTAFLEQRWSDGAMPFCGGATPRTQIHLRFRDEPRTDESTVIALADAIPSPGISVLRKPAPASSMTWTLELLRDRVDDFPDGYWCMDAEATSAADGYIFQTATLWSPDGQAVALSRQGTAVFG